MVTFLSYFLTDALFVAETFFMYTIAVVSSEQMRTDGNLYNFGLWLNLIH